MTRCESGIRVGVEGLKAEKVCKIVEKFAKLKPSVGMIRASRSACNCQSETSATSSICSTGYNVDDACFSRGFSSPVPRPGSNARTIFAKNILQSEAVFIMSGHCRQVHRQGRRLVRKMENGNSASRSGCAFSTAEVFEPSPDGNKGYLRNSSGGVHVSMLMVTFGEIGLAA